MPHALILVDIQNDYFPGGAMELVGAAEAGANARLALERFRAAGDPVIHVQHVSTRPGSTFFLPDTAGAEIHACVAPLAGEAVVVKHYPNGFRETPLLERLRAVGADHLVVCGMMTHMCVDACVRAAADLGFGCTVLGDACATRDLAHGGQLVPAAMVHAAFLAALAGAYAAVTTTGEYLSQPSA